MAASGGQFSCPLGMGVCANRTYSKWKKTIFWNDKNSELQFYYKLFLWFNWWVFHIIHFFLVASCNFDHSNSHFLTFPYNLRCRNCPVDQLSNADSHFWPMTYLNHSIQNYPRHLYLFHQAKWFSICSEIDLKQAWKCSSCRAWANLFGSPPVWPQLHFIPTWSKSILGPHKYFGQKIF